MKPRNSSKLALKAASDRTNTTTPQLTMKLFFTRFNQEEDTRPLWLRLVFNKYIIVLLIFLGIFLFSGDKSLIDSFRRSQRIRQTKAQIERTRKQIDECHREIRTMSNTDSLERFARENYYMHAEGEDVYLIGK